MEERRFEGENSVLDGGLARQDFAEDFHRELGLAVVGVQAVLLLLDVGQLGVAEGAVMRGLSRMRVGQAAVALDELLLGLGAVAVAPAALSSVLQRMPPYSLTNTGGLPS